MLTALAVTAAILTALAAYFHRSLSTYSKHKPQEQTTAQLRSHTTASPQAQDATLPDPDPLPPFDLSTKRVR